MQPSTVLPTEARAKLRIEADLIRKTYPNSPRTRAQHIDYLLAKIKAENPEAFRPEVLA